MSTLNDAPIVVNFHAIQTTPFIELNLDGTGFNTLTMNGGIKRIQTSADAWKISIRNFYLQAGGDSKTAAALFGDEHNSSGQDHDKNYSAHVSPAISVHEVMVAHDFEEFYNYGHRLTEPQAVAVASYTSYRHASVGVSALAHQLGSMAEALQALQSFGRAFTLSQPPVGEACNTIPTVVLAEINEDPLDLTSQFEERHNLSSNEAAMLLLQRPTSFAATAGLHLANELKTDVNASRVPNLPALFDAIEDAVITLGARN